MIKNITLVLALIFGIAAEATPVIKNYYTIIVDENGNGFIAESIGNQVLDIQPLSFSTSIADPFVEAHPDNNSVPNALTLSYALPSVFGGLNLSRIIIGDIILDEPTSQTGSVSGLANRSDLLRIGANGRLYFYSDIDADEATSGLRTLADVGVPNNNQLISKILTEISLRGLAPCGLKLSDDAAGLNYLPTRGQAGYGTNAIVNFYVISSGNVPGVPEPGTLIAGALMLLPLGATVVRKLLKS